MRWSHGRITLLMLGGIIVLAIALGILFGTDLVLHDHPVPFPLIAGGAALACLFVLRLRGSGPGGGPGGAQGGPGPRP
jgi:hypothetical protein